VPSTAEGRHPSRDAQIGVRVRSSLKADLERLAKEDKRKLSNYIEILLEAHVADKKREAKRR
jgi:hypothetical protein